MGAVATGLRHGWVIVMAQDSDNTATVFRQRVFQWAWRTLEEEARSGFPSFGKVESPWWAFWANKFGSLSVETRIHTLRMLLRKGYPQESADLWGQGWTAEDDVAFAQYDRASTEWATQHQSNEMWRRCQNRASIRFPELKRLVTEAIRKSGHNPIRPRHEGFVGWDVEVDGWIVHSRFERSRSQVMELFHEIFSAAGETLTHADKLGWPLGLGSMSDWDEITPDSAARVIGGAMFCAGWYLRGCREWLAGLPHGQPATP